MNSHFSRQKQVVMSVEPIPVDQPPDPVVVVAATEESVIATPVPAYPESISPDAPPRPVTRPNVLTICIVILTVCAVGAILTVLRPIITPVLIGVFLFFLVNPFI